MKEGKSVVDVDEEEEYQCVHLTGLFSVSSKQSHSANSSGQRSSDLNAVTQKKSPARYNVGYSSNKSQESDVKENEREKLL